MVSIVAVHNFVSIIIIQATEAIKVEDTIVYD